MKMIIVLVALVAAVAAAPRTTTSSTTSTTTSPREVTPKSVAQRGRTTTSSTTSQTTSPRQVTPKPVAILQRTHHNNIGVIGGYQYSYEQDDGQSRYETAEPIEITNEDGKLVPINRISGHYTFIHPKTNEVFKVTYVADHNGFVAKVPKVE